MGDVEVPGSFVGTLKFSVTPLLFETALFGAHTLLVALSVYILSGKGLSISRRTVLLAAVLFIYICSTTHWAIALAVFHRFIGHPAEASGYTVTEMAVSVVATGIDITLSDAIVLWRAHVVWGRGKVIVFVSLFMFILTPMSFLANVVIMLRALTAKPLSQAAGNTIIGGLSILSSCLTNVWATSLVVFKTVKYRQEFMKDLRKYRRGRSERVLMLLIESGVLYSVFWVVLLTLSWIGIVDAQMEEATQPELIDAQNTIVSGMAQLCGIYPTIVIVAVCLQGVTYDPAISTGQIPGLDTEDGDIITELEFAAHGIRTQATIRRSVTVSVGLPVSSTDPVSEQESNGRRGEDNDKKSRTSEPMYELHA